MSSDDSSLCVSISYDILINITRCFHWLVIWGGGGEYLEFHLQSICVKKRCIIIMHPPLKLQTGFQKLLKREYHKTVKVYRGTDKSLARPTYRCILFDGENISFDASLVIYIYI